MKKLFCSLPFIVGLGCSDTTDPHVPPPPPPPEPTEISLTTNRVTLVTIGDSAWIGATVRDQYGQGMTGQVVRWASGDTSIVTVSQAGFVKAVGNGVAKVWAELGSLSDTAIVTVNDPLGYEYRPDREALIAFFEQTNGGEWLNNAGWAEPRTPMKDWYGVYVSYDSAVGKMRPERVHLSYDRIFGYRFPGVAIGQLTHLRALNLANSSWGSADEWTGNCFSGRLRPEWPPCRPSVAVPREIMSLTQLDSLNLGWELCVPGPQQDLLEWVRSREVYATSHPVWSVHPSVWKTAPCLTPEDITGIPTVLVQSVSLGDSILEGRDTWIAARPVRKLRSRTVDSVTVQKWLSHTWPEVRGRVCQKSGPCNELEMRQRSARYTIRGASSDSVMGMFSEHTGFAYKRASLGDYYGQTAWKTGVAVGKIPGVLVRPGMTIHVELYSRTVGDTIRLADRVYEPVVFSELAPLPLTMVAVVPPNQECRDSIHAGRGLTANCHEWPDSSYAEYRLVREDAEIEDAAFFSRLRHWFPTAGVDAKWHNEFLYSTTISDEGEDLALLDRMRREADDGRYWVGVWCLVAYCDKGFPTLGIAYQGGKSSMTVPHPSVVAHEIGHNLGLYHPPDDSIGALAIGKWPFGEYVEDPIPGAMHTFMHVQRTNLTDREGESIAPWQFRHIMRRLTMAQPTGQVAPKIVVN
ncbi:MAG: hypothetical protein OXH49_08460 [Gemmatimonadetes bacterium]|nr:hypothetical protein [Gemmatimonadota bacterium]